VFTEPRDAGSYRLLAVAVALIYRVTMQVVTADHGRGAGDDSMTGGQPGVVPARSARSSPPAGTLSVAHGHNDDDDDGPPPAAWAARPAILWAVFSGGSVLLAVGALLAAAVHNAGRNGTVVLLAVGSVLFMPFHLTMMTGVRDPSADALGPGAPGPGRRAPPGQPMSRVGPVTGPARAGTCPPAVRSWASTTATAGPLFCRPRPARRRVF